MSDILFKELDTAFLFNVRPESIPADLRPIWRIALILLILRLSSRGGKSTLSRLHLLSWTLISRSNCDTLAQFLNGKMRPQAAIVRIDPALNRAIDFGIGEGLMKKETGNRITLTGEGIKRADIIISTKNVFSAEKAALSLFGSGVTESFVNKLFSGKE